MRLRVARHTERLDEVVAFYRDGLGLSEIGGFRDHDGYDGVFLAVPGTGAHLELTSGGGHGARHRTLNRCSCSTSATIRPSRPSRRVSASIRSLPRTRIGPSTG